MQFRNENDVCFQTTENALSVIKEFKNLQKKKWEIEKKKQLLLVIDRRPIYFE